MANLTVTIDAELLKRARMRALERGVSVNRLVDPHKKRRADSILESRDCAALVVSTHYTVVSPDVPMVHKAIETSRMAQLSYWDALTIEAAASAGCDRVLTEDLATGSIFRGVRIDNPFSADDG